MGRTASAEPTRRSKSSTAPSKLEWATQLAGLVLHFFCPRGGRACILCRRFKLASARVIIACSSEPGAEIFGGRPPPTTSHSARSFGAAEEACAAPSWRQLGRCGVYQRSSVLDATGLTAKRNSQRMQK